MSVFVAIPKAGSFACHYQIFPRRVGLAWISIEASRGPHPKGDKPFFAATELQLLLSLSNFVSELQYVLLIQCIRDPYLVLIMVHSHYCNSLFKNRRGK